LLSLFILDKYDDFTLGFRMSYANEASSGQSQKFLLQGLCGFRQ
jgi:hypothetical protein